MMALYTINVKPSSRKGPLIMLGEDGLLTAFVREAAVGGKANTATRDLLAKYLGVPKTAVKLIRGHKNKQKLYEVHLG